MSERDPVWKRETLSEAMFKTWNDVLRICFVAVVITGCAVTFMMLTASNPSADDFWRAAGVAGGGIATFLAGKHIGERA